MKTHIKAKTNSLVKACLISALVGSVVTGLPLYLKSRKLEKSAESLKDASDAAWSDAFVSIIRLSVEGKLRVVNIGEPWVLNNASVHDCVIVGASAWNLGTNSSINNSEIPGTPTEFRNAASAKIGKMWTR